MHYSMFFRLLVAISMFIFSKSEKFRGRHMAVINYQQNLTTNAQHLYATAVETVTDCILTCMAHSGCQSVQVSDQPEDESVIGYAIVDCHLYGAIDRDPAPWDGFVIQHVQQGKVICF